MMFENVDELIKALNHNENDEFIFQRNCENNQFYFRKKHFKSFFQHLNGLRDEKKFCDIIIKPKENAENQDENHIIYAHKIIICSASPYFKTLLCGGFKENEFINEITIENIDCDCSCINGIIDYFYTGEIAVNESNVQGLLAAAQILQVDDVVSVCCIYLEHNMNVNNCIGIEEFATRYGCVDLVK
jgi:hypothetical protein